MGRFIRHDNKIVLTVILLIIILILLCLCLVMWFRTGEEASVGIFSLAITLLGTIFIAVELKNGQNVTCSDMLIDLNNYFHDSDRLMKVYEVLECHETDREACAGLWKDVKSIEVAHYCTFFENLYLLYRNDVAAIEDLDDLFGYRFFIFVNNPYIQENYILPTSSSYVQIFKLYEAWIKYRKKKGGRNWTEGIPYAQFMFSEKYLKEKLYLHDFLLNPVEPAVVLNIHDVSFIMRQLTFENLGQVLALQDECVHSLSSDDLYCPLTREELIESLHLDKAVGIFTSDQQLAAVAVVVGNRISSRNLAADTGREPLETLTFDAVLVSPRWRGYGLQRIFIQWSIDKACAMNISQVLTTVSPDNHYSYNNFTALGFKHIKTAIKYGGVKRDILEYCVNTQDR